MGHMAYEIGHIEYEIGHITYEIGHGILLYSPASKNHQYTGFRKMYSAFEPFCMILVVYNA